MNDWIEHQRRTARVEATDDVKPHLDAIARWRDEAATLANEHTHDHTKQALKEHPPTGPARSSLFCLYAIKADTVFHICRDALDAYTRSGYEDEPHLSLSDVLSESWVLFCRAMIRYEGVHSLTIHLQRRFRDRVLDYVESQLSTPDDANSRGPVADTKAAFPHFDIPELYDELRAEGKLTEEAAELWDRGRP